MGAAVVTGRETCARRAKMLLALLLNDARPVGVCLPQISLGVLVEVFANAETILKEQTPIHDLEGVRIDRGRVASRNGPGTKPSKLRFVLCGIGVEGGLILSRGKIIRYSVQIALKLSVTFDCFAITEITNWIVTFYAHTIPINI